jgi:hypothetical protein
MKLRMDGALGIRGAFQFQKAGTSTPVSALAPTFAQDDRQ